MRAATAAVTARVPREEAPWLRASPHGRGCGHCSLDGRGVTSVMWLSLVDVCILDLLGLKRACSLRCPAWRPSAVLGGSGCCSPAPQSPAEPADEGLTGL